MGSMFRWERFFDNIPRIFPYFTVTLQIVMYATFLGVLLGLLVAVVRIRRIPVLYQLASVYVSFMRGTPMLVQMMVIYYGLPLLSLHLLGININRWDKILFIDITFALNQGAFLSEIFRSAILAIPVGQTEAGYSVGLTRWQTFRRIILPQAARIAIPSFGNDFVGLFQNTSLAFMIGVVDLMGRAQTIGATTKHVLEAYVFVAIVFIVVSLLARLLFFYVDKRLGRGKPI